MIEMALDFEQPLTVERLNGLAEVLRKLAEATKEYTTTNKPDYTVSNVAAKVAKAIEERVEMETEKWRADHDVAFPKKDAEYEALLEVFAKADLAVSQVSLTTLWAQELFGAVEKVRVVRAEAKK